MHITQEIFFRYDSDTVYISILLILIGHQLLSIVIVVGYSLIHSHLMSCSTGEMSDRTGKEGTVFRGSDVLNATGSNLGHAPSSSKTKESTNFSIRLFDVFLDLKRRILETVAACRIENTCKGRPAFCRVHMTY